MSLAVATPISAAPDTALNVAENVAFGVIAAMMIFSALRVVTTKNVVHAAMWLVLVLAGAAAQYILLAAEFVAVTQVLVYIGAVIVLFLFGVMLTRAKLGQDNTLTRKNWYGGAFVAVILFALLSFSVIDTWEDTRLPDERQTGLAPAFSADASEAELEAAVEHPNVGSNSAAVSDSIFSQYLVAFEVVSVMLTAALIGAIVIARKE
jgi:NADH-quinone oxidoreductase subunit J